MAGGCGSTQWGTAVVICAACVRPASDETGPLRLYRIPAEGFGSVDTAEIYLHDECAEVLGIPERDMVDEDQ